MPRPVAPALALALVCLLPLAAAAPPVKALGNFFEPGSLTIAAGETVVWTNDDSMAHTVTSTWDDGASFDAALQGGESFQHAFDAAGSYTIHCRPHAYPSDETGQWEGMVMTIEVTPVAADAGIAGPLRGVPGPALAFVLVIVAMVGATLLPHRKR